MEIYNENAYDLLDKSHVELPLESWNKVRFLKETNKILFYNI